MSIKNFLSHPVFASGTDDQMSDQAKKRIVLTNQLAAGLLVLMFPNIIQFYSFVGFTTPFISIAILLFVTPLFIVFNRFNLHKTAKFALLIHFCFASTIIGATVSSNNPDVHAVSRGFLYIAVFIPMVLFESHEWRWSVLGIIIIVVALLAIEPIQSGLDIGSMPPEKIPGAVNQVFILLILLCAGTYYLSQRIDLNILQTLLNRSITSEMQYKNLSEELDERVKIRTQELALANTELNLALVQLKASQAQLLQSEKLSAIGKMVAGVAHEVNTPRASLDHYITIVERQISHALTHDNLTEYRHSNEVIRDEYLPSMEASINRIGELTDGLLNFTRTEHTSQKLTDVKMIMNSVLVILKSQLDRRIQIVTDFEEIPLLMCYPGQINQLFMNILNNAVEAISGDGIITIQIIRQSDAALIQISDTGIGMDEETIEKMFDPFFTTKEIGQGTGLGLSVAWDIVQRHEGLIKVTSKIGEGTVVTISLPHSPVETQNINT